MEWVQKTKARRIIDEENCLYLMSMRYKCKNNIDGNRHTFMGYAKEIVRQLPVRFQADFPAVLTYKSGFSTPLLRSLRPVFQNATGPHRMNQILRVRHTELYDITQLQYYDAIVELKEERATKARLLGFSNYVDENRYPEFSTFSDPNGYNGYIPSAGYISYVYCSFIKELRPYMDQHQSLLDGKILKGDHSFKIIKKMNKTNGVSDYSCLYTVMNEFEEIKMQVLAPTKSLKHVIPSYNNMMASYHKYKFELPQIFYADNVIGYRAVLEEVMPSSLENVEHIKPTQAELIQRNGAYSTLPLAQLPDDIEVDASCFTTGVSIGFDCEWAYQGSVIPLIERASVLFREVSLVQIAYESQVYLFRVHHFYQDTFPCKLAELLLSDKVTKIGRGVANDLRRFGCFGVNNCKGQLEIGTLCKDKDLASNGRSNLSSLCGEVLGLQLPKVREVRCGNWEAQSLSQEQTTYAALDAWIVLDPYNKCKDLPTVNARVYGSTPERTLVSINIEQGKINSAIAAFGYLQPQGTPSSSHQDKARKIGKFTASVKLCKILIPGFSLDTYSPEVTLQDFEEDTELNPSEISTNTPSAAITLSLPDDVTSSSPPVSNGPAAVPSRILRDVFHVLDLIKVKLSHGMAKDFTRRSRDAFPAFHPHNKGKVEGRLISIASDLNSCLLST
ncbi:unnamed protein product [Mucor hiemalis]